MTVTRSEAAAQAYQQASECQQRDDLIVTHLDFVRHVFGKIVANLPDGVDVENLESAGILGLVEAAQQFDATRGVPFKTFAYPRIRGAIIDELRRNCPLPQQMLQAISRVRRAYESLEPPVTLEEIARKANMTVVKVEQCLEAVRLTRPGVWDDAQQPGHLRASDDDRRPETPVEMAESKEVLADCIEKLPEQERLVITLYHLEDLRLKEIGKVLGLSESRVSRILTKAEFRLGEQVKARTG